MSLILNIETTTHVCSAALSENGQLVRLREDHEGRSHASLLALFIKEILQQEKLKVSDLDAVSISKGPGSYTGLRIGVSTAKGLCYGAGLPLLAVPTLQALTQGLLTSLPESNQLPRLDEHTLLIPMLDARRMEVYSAVLNRNLEFVRDVRAEIIEESSYDDWLEGHSLVFFGNGAEKCREVITHPNATFIPGIEPSARYMISLSEQRFTKHTFEDVAYFEPFYLKDFIATKPKKNIIQRNKPGT